MTTYTQHSPHVSDNEPAPPAQRVSPVLWAALAVALIAALVWWTRQDRIASAPIDTGTAPVAAMPAVEDAAPSGARAPAARTSDTPRPVIADRAPRPLDGNPLPVYPREALRAGNEGSVVVSIAVDSEGVPTDVRVVERSGARDRSLERAAVNAARQWRFEPAIRDGKPVAATVQLPVDFRQQG